jgi:hypothetical protein
MTEKPYDKKITENAIHDLTMLCVQAQFNGEPPNCQPSTLSEFAVVTYIDFHNRIQLFANNYISSNVGEGYIEEKLRDLANKVFKDQK